VTEQHGRPLVATLDTPLQVVGELLALVVVGHPYDGVHEHRSQSIGPQRQQRGHQGQQRQREAAQHERQERTDRAALGPKGERVGGPRLRQRTDDPREERDDVEKADEQAGLQDRRGRAPPPERGHAPVDRIE
jgi:hypothetical protein